MTWAEAVALQHAAAEAIGREPLDGTDRVGELLDEALDVLKAAANQTEVSNAEWYEAYRLAGNATIEFCRREQVADRDALITSVLVKPVESHAVPFWRIVDVLSSLARSS